MKDERGEGGEGCEGEIIIKKEGRRGDYVNILKKDTNPLS